MFFCFVVSFASPIILEKLLWLKVSALIAMQHLISLLDLVRGLKRFAIFSPCSAELGFTFHY